MTTTKNKTEQKTLIKNPTMKISIWNVSFLKMEEYSSVYKIFNTLRLSVLGCTTFFLFIAHATLKIFQWLIVWVKETYLVERNYKKDTTIKQNNKTL